MKESLFIFTDGGARGNPGPAAVGFLIQDHQGKTLVEKGLFIGRATNNVAEYKAVIAALSWLKEKYSSAELSNFLINFFLDSKLIVNQLTGVYKIKKAHLIKLALLVKSLEQETGLQLRYFFTPREKNRRADALVNQTLDFH